MDANMVIALVGVVISGVVGIGGCLRFVTSTADAVRRETAENLKEGLKGEAHSRNNALQPVNTWLQRVETDVSELQRETVRRADLSAFEARLTRLDGKMDGFGDKLDAFKDAVLARMGPGRS